MDPESIDKFDKLYEIYSKINNSTLYGKGTGVIYLARIRTSTSAHDGYYAVKKISSYKNKYFNMEIEITRIVDHPNIIKCHQIFKDSSTAFMVLDYYSTDLCDILEQDKPIEGSLIKKWIDQLIGGIKYLHSLSIIHGDIKPDNVLIDRKNNLKIIDFGLSYFYEGTPTTYFFGTVQYMAPESVYRGIYKEEALNSIIQESQDYTYLLNPEDDYALDWWSLGVAIYFMITKNLLFNDYKYKDIYDQILHRPINLDIPAFNKLQPDIKEITKALLCRSPVERMNNIRKILI